MAVVKADGYGHGATQTGRAALAAGATELGVATIEEAIALRRDGITAPVLAWLHPPGTDFAPALDADVQIAVSSLRQIGELRDAAERTGRAAKVTVKVDTGLNRNGASPAEYPAMLTALKRALADNAFTLRGLMSHLVHGDVPDHPLNDVQAQRLKEMVGQARDAGCAVRAGALEQLAFGVDAARSCVRHGPARNRGVRSDADPRARRHGVEAGDDAEMPCGAGAPGARG